MVASVVGIGLDWSCRLAAVLLWTLWWRWGRSVTRPGRQWWAAGLVAMALTAYTDPVATVLQLLTGVRNVEVPVLHVAAVLAAAAAIEAQCNRASRCARWMLLFAALVASAVLVRTWEADVDPFGGGIDEPAIARAVAGSAWHRGVFAAVMVLAGISFGRGLLRQLADTPAGPLRQALRLVLLGVGAVTVWGGLQLVVVSMLAAGAAWTPVGMAVVTLAAVISLGLIGLLGVGAAALRRARIRRRDLGVDYRDVTALRDWLDEQLGARHRPHPRHESAVDLMGVVCETRDRMWMVQARISQAQLHAVVDVGRRLGLSGERQRAFAAAAALELAVRTDRGRTADPADLSRLGGAYTPEAEVRWLAQVQRARVQLPAEAAATLVLQDGAAAPTSGRGRGVGATGLPRIAVGVEVG